MILSPQKEGLIGNEFGTEAKIGNEGWKLEKTCGFSTYQYHAYCDDSYDPNIRKIICISLWLVGGFNPSEKYYSKWKRSPNRGENKNIWNHHLAMSVYINLTSMEKPHSPTLNPRRGGAHKSHARLLSHRPAEDRSTTVFCWWFEGFGPKDKIDNINWKVLF